MPTRWQAWEARHLWMEAASAPDTPRSRAPRERAGPVPADVLDGVPYVELHLHSCYSLLDGASRVGEMVDAAREMGHRALALTDHNGMFGSLEFARALKDAGLLPITGLELTIAEDDSAEAPRSHITLLAETQQGYSNLCRLSSLTFGLGLEGTKEKEARRLDPWVFEGELERHAEGVIALTGCREGKLARRVGEGRTDEAEGWLRRLVGWYGEEGVFVELQDNLVFGDRPRNRGLVALAERVGVGVVGTGNVHYHHPSRHRLQDVMVAIRTRQSLDGSHRERRPNAEFYLRSPEEQAARFASYHPEAAANTVRIARRCTFDLTEDLGYRLPSPPVREGLTPLEELERVCRERMAERYPGRDERTLAEARLLEELRLVAKHDLAGFFLIYHQVFQLAGEVAREIRGPGRRGRSHLPPGRGRGSSVSSIICYLIGLSHIDPIRNNLFIGRFLNEEMHSLPDIDL
ncbi:MAG TPA: PHP domain-containing protein, partial [Tepidiformaceae bacterium]|nr:PHP domain-containing protein [Tepidiformaceae bacterium]